MKTLTIDSFLGRAGRVWMCLALVTCIACGDDAALSAEDEAASADAGDGESSRRRDALEFQLKYAPSPSGLTFDKVFSRLNASGGGASDTLVVVTRDIRLTSDHRVEVGSFAGVSSSGGTVTSTAPDQRGTYAIDGYTVELKWDSGKITKTSFYYSDQDPRVVYVGGVAYLTKQ